MSILVVMGIMRLAWLHDFHGYMRRRKGWVTFMHIQDLGNLAVHEFTSIKVLVVKTERPGSFISMGSENY